MRRLPAGTVLITLAVAVARVSADPVLFTLAVAVVVTP